MRWLAAVALAATCAWASTKTERGDECRTLAKEIYSEQFKTTLKCSVSKDYRKYTCSGPGLTQQTIFRSKRDFFADNKIFGKPTRSEFVTIVDAYGLELRHRYAYDREGLLARIEIDQAITLIESHDEKGRPLRGDMARIGCPVQNVRFEVDEDVPSITIFFDSQGPLGGDCPPPSSKQVQTYDKNGILISNVFYSKGLSTVSDNYEVIDVMRVCK